MNPTRTIIAVILIALVSGCMVTGASGKDEILSKADAKWQRLGYQTVEYEGWQMGSGIPFTRYGSAKVWHQLRRIPDNGIAYSGYLVRWGDEIHVYGPHAIDAIKP